MGWRVLCWVVLWPLNGAVTTGGEATTSVNGAVTPGTGTLTPGGETTTSINGAVTPTPTPTPGGEATMSINGAVTPTPGGEATTSVNESVTPGGEATTSVNESVTPGGGVMTSVNGSVTPGGETVTSVNGSVTPGGGVMTSVNGSVTPGGEAMTSVNGSVTPGGEATMSVNGAVTPGGGAMTSVNGSVTPGGETVTSVNGSVTPGGGAVTQSPEDVTANILRAAVPICTCDLTDGVCELSCCCDPDCTSADINVFSSCLPGSEPVISQVCIEDSVIFTSNSPFPTVIHKDRSHSRFCVMVNDPKTNEFVAPQPLGRERFRSLVSQFGRGSFIIPSQQDIFDGRIKAASKDAYQFGDQIYTLFPEASVLGVFIQPTALVGGECTDRSPAVFLQSQSSTCFRRVGDVKAACDTLPALNAATYYGNFVLLPTLNFTSASKVKILPEGGQVVSSPRLMDNMCNNVVSEVTYRIQYKGGKGIDGAWVTFALTNVSLSATKIQQTFHVFFMTEPASSAAERRSGNPGYLKGKPILAFNGQAAVSLTVLKSDSDGSCSQSGRSSVLFRHNMKAGCSYRLAPRQTCSERQTHINLLLLGDTPPDSLGILGNASGSQTEGLTRIINPLPEAPSELCKSSCSLTLALEIQILWAYMGPLANPQAAVLGARFQYHRQDVPCSTGAVSLRTSVTFIETTRYPPAPRDHPTTDWKLPFDFFYPFKVSTSGVAVLAGSMLGSVCSVIVMGFLGQH